MSSYRGRRICLTPQVSGVGGMVSFRDKLEKGLAERNIEVSHHPDDRPYEAVLVIGGTRQLPQLWRAKRGGIRIVQRLDGMNWLHRVRKTSARRTETSSAGARHYIRAEYSNWLLAVIRRRLAERIVYQSRFAQGWWERTRGPARAASSVIYNGVDLSVYSPEGNGSPPQDRVRILMVEGSLMGGYEMGVGMAVELGEGLEERLKAAHSLTSGMQAVELMVVGRVSEAVKDQWQRRSRIPIRWAGQVAPERIPEIDRAAHLLYSGDIHPACPNSVIEAMACGLPVLAYDTGALSELVGESGGCVVPYGGDAWRLEKPDHGVLVDGAVQILQNLEESRLKARLRAEQAFGLAPMVEEYIQVLLEA